VECTSSFLATGRLGCVTSMKIWISVYRKQALCKVFMEFISLMDRKKCWYNTSLQVLRAAPALHSLNISFRQDVSHILKFLTHTHDDLKKLILKYCSLGGDCTAFFANVVELFPDLEVLSLEDCAPLSSAGYRLIPQLKKLSELKLSNNGV